MLLTVNKHLNIQIDLLNPCNNPMSWEGMRSPGWALISQVWGPYKKRK